MPKRLKSDYQFKDIRGIQNLKRLGYILGEKPLYLTELSVQKNNYYKPFIDKPPGKKPRLIDQPTGELRRVQTKIRDRILYLAPLSKVSYGGVEGKSTKDNAQQHLHKNELVKLDLRDCFHNAKTRMVKRLFKNRFGYSDQVSELLAEICTYQGYVPVGSTLSSTLVNHVLNPVWEKIDRECIIEDLAFTTWVDDIAISGKSATEEINKIKKIINSYGLPISWNKLEVQRNNKAQEVTGSCVNSKKVSVSKKKRREIIESIKNNPSSPKTSGLIAFASTQNLRQGRQLKKLKDKLAS